MFVNILKQKIFTVLVSRCSRRSVWKTWSSLATSREKMRGACTCIFSVRRRGVLCIQRKEKCLKPLRKPTTFFQTKGKRKYMINI